MRAGRRAVARPDLDGSAARKPGREEQPIVGHGHGRAVVKPTAHHDGAPLRAIGLPEFREGRPAPVDREVELPPHDRGAPVERLGVELDARAAAADTDVLHEVRSRHRAVARPQLIAVRSVVEDEVGGSGRSGRRLPEAPLHAGKDVAEDERPGGCPVAPPRLLAVRSVLGAEERDRAGGHDLPGMTASAAGPDVLDEVGPAARTVRAHELVPIAVVRVRLEDQDAAEIRSPSDQLGRGERVVRHIGAEPIGSPELAEEAAVMKEAQPSSGREATGRALEVVELPHDRACAALAAPELPVAVEVRPPGREDRGVADVPDAALQPVVAVVHGLLRGRRELHRAGRRAVRHRHPAEAAPVQLGHREVEKTARGGQRAGLRAGRPGHEVLDEIRRVGPQACSAREQQRQRVSSERRVSAAHDDHEALPSRPGKAAGSLLVQDERSGW